MSGRLSGLGTLILHYVDVTTGYKLHLVANMDNVSGFIIFWLCITLFEDTGYQLS